MSLKCFRRVDQNEAIMFAMQMDYCGTVYSFVDKDI